MPKNMHVTLLTLLLLSLSIPTLSIALKGCTPDFTSWPPPVSTLPNSFSLHITAQATPGKSFSLSLHSSTVPAGFSTNLTTASPGPNVSLKDGYLIFSNLIFGRNSVEDKSTLPKKLFFLGDGTVRNGGMKFQAVYVCDIDGIERRVLKQVETGQGVIAAGAFKEGGGLVAVIMEDQILKPDIWLEIV